MSNIKKLDWYWRSGGAAVTPLKMIFYGDMHVAEDKTNGRNSLGKMFTDYIASELEHEIGISWGDYSANRTGDKTPLDAEATNILLQYANAPYERAYYYQLLGNHDAGNADESPLYDWWRTYIDPAGENPGDSGVINANRPYAINQIDSVPLYLGYYIEIGNLLIVMMGDDNASPTSQSGRGNAPTSSSGYPTGGVSEDLWNGIVSLMVKNQDKNIILVGHQAIRGTTGVSDYTEGTAANKHGTDPNDPGGEGYIFAIGTDKGTTYGTDKPHTLFSQFQGLIDVYFHGHTHPKLVWSWNGKGLVRNCYGQKFINGGCLTQYWVNIPGDAHPQSNYLTLDGANLKIQKYAHSTLGGDEGIVDSLEQNLTLRSPFVRSYSASAISAPSTQPSGLTFDRGTSTSIRLTWTGNDKKYLVLQRSGAAPTGTPSDGTVYRVGDTIGDGTVVFMGDQTDVEIMGLTNGVTYHYAVFAFECGGNSILYNTTSPLTGNHTIAATSLFLHEEVPYNVFDYKKWTRAYESASVAAGAYIFADDNKIKFHAEGSVNTGNMITLPNAWKSIATVTSGLVTLVFTIDALGSAGSTNVIVAAAIYNDNVAGNKGFTHVARIIYGPGDELRCQVILSGTKTDESILTGITDGTFKITYNFTTDKINFYRWQSGAWALVGGPYTRNLNVAGNNFKCYLAVQDSTSNNGVQDVEISNLYFANADIAGLTP